MTLSDVFRYPQLCVMGKHLDFQLVTKLQQLLLMQLQLVDWIHNWKRMLDSTQRILKIRMDWFLSLSIDPLNSTHKPLGWKKHYPRRLPPPRDPPTSFLVSVWVEGRWLPGWFSDLLVRFAGSPSNSFRSRKKSRTVVLIFGTCNSEDCRHLQNDQLLWVLF